MPSEPKQQLPFLVRRHEFLLEGELPISIGTAFSPPSGQPSPAEDRTDKWHFHEFHELTIVRSGTGLHQVDDHSFPVGPGDVFVLKGTQKHRFTDRQDLTVINLMYVPDELPLPRASLRQLPGYRALFELGPEMPQSQGGSAGLCLSSAQLQHTVDMIEGCRGDGIEESGSDVMQYALLLELMVYLARALEDANSAHSSALLRLSHVISAMERDWSRHWTIDELAEKAAMSRNHFMRLFRQATGRTALEYALNLRIRQAAVFLLKTPFTIAEIAEKTGFTDSNYFSRQFRKHFGCSPREYKKKSHLRET